MAEARPEPSMEDILASIKRIISDEQTPPPPGAVPSPVHYEPAPHPPAARSSGAPVPGWPRPGESQAPESILELTDRVPTRVPDRTADIPPPPRFPPEPAAPVQRAVERLRQAEAEMPQPMAPRPVPRDLMPRTPTPRPTGGDVTLDTLVRETLQPLLSDWIDRNLPDMVERLVQAEIRRMMDKEG